MFRKIAKNWLDVFFLLAAFALVNTLDVSAAPSMVCATGSNLIVNGDAEADASSYASGNDIDVTGWNPENGEFTIGKYGFDSFPNATDPGPANRGGFLFAGGNVASSSGSQIINVADCAAQIDAGNLGFSLSGFLGGYDGQDDNVQLTITFRDVANSSLGTATIGQVLSADRGGFSGLLARNTNGTVPVGTRTVEVVLLMTRTSGTYNDGYADNLSFMLTAPTAATVSVGGRVMTTRRKGIRNVTVTMTDSAGNVRMTISTESGYYRFDDVEVGKTYVLSVQGKRYTFNQASQVTNINEETNDINFIGYSQKIFI